MTVIRRALVLAVVLAGPSLSWAAAATWTAASGASRSVVGTCSGSGTCDVPSAATDGINLDAVASVSIVVCAASGQTISSGTVTLYYYDAAVGLWAKSPQTFTPSASVRCAVLEGDSPGHGIPVITPRGRMAPKLDVTLSSGSATVYILATGVKSEAL
jgi:hypothetical protein